MRVAVDNTTPLGFGFEKQIDVFFENSPVMQLAPSAALRGVKPVSWFDSKEPLRSGWAWGQHYLDGGTAGVDVTLGKGKVFLIGPEITFRAQPHGTFKFLFNSIFYGTAQAVGGPTAETAARGRVGSKFEVPGSRFYGFERVEVSLIVMTSYGPKDMADSFRTVRKNTILVAQDIPEDKYDYRAAEGVMSVAEMLAHLASSTHWAEQLHFAEQKREVTLRGLRPLHGGRRGGRRRPEDQGRHPCRARDARQHVRFKAGADDRRSRPPSPSPSRRRFSPRPSRGSRC